MQTPEFAAGKLQKFLQIGGLDSQAAPGLRSDGFGRLLGMRLAHYAGGMVRLSGARVRRPASPEGAYTARWTSS